MVKETPIYLESDKGDHGKEIESRLTGIENSIKDALEKNAESTTQTRAVPKTGESSTMESDGTGSTTRGTYTWADDADVILEERKELQHGDSDNQAPDEGWTDVTPRKSKKMS